MQKFKHKYIFYFYPKYEITGKVLKGFFRFYGRVKDGKEHAERIGREYDHQKLF